MAVFSAEKIHEIGRVLKAAEVEKQGEKFYLKIADAASRRSLSLEIYPDTTLGSEKGAMVVVYTPTSHLQLHNVSGFVTSEELGEVTFVAESGGRLSGLVVERVAACSLYANVNRQLISGDFTKLGVEVMLSGVALSLAEELVEKPKKK
ncbi:MAG TPA: hypothetical protein VNL73_07820 [Verrucomicrobiae bacterium]|nr:hypothetical protein [Verrucomicrobiae bacterium]